ncbi:hypothetical protein ACF1AJ_13870 [Leifsonia sp. NPDC014704]|uniref:hypothetical protein n=1 Tax=Leifsonia sp. NPDC014704 TaxID=3364123 RepID=UPI0036F4A6F5
MSNIIRIFAATGLAVAAALSITACAPARSAHSSITYVAWAEGGNIATVAPYTVDGLNGAMVLTEDVNDTRWHADADGGAGPQITVTPENAETVAGCEIRERATGKVLDSQTGTPGEAARCEVVPTKPAR